MQGDPEGVVKHFEPCDLHVFGDLLLDALVEGVGDASADFAGQGVAEQFGACYFELEGVAGGDGGEFEAGCAAAEFDGEGVCFGVGGHVGDVDEGGEEVVADGLLELLVEDVADERGGHVCGEGE